MPLSIDRCRNVDDFRALAKRRLPYPVFHYIDGAAEDETSSRRNTAAFAECDLVPSVLAGVEHVDMSVTVLGRKLSLPIFCSPTALQRLFHHDGERAVARATEKFGTYCALSSLGTVSIEEIRALGSAPKMFQLYFHRDRALNWDMIDRCKAARFDALTLVVDSITGGNRERDLRTGFTSPPRLTARSLASFALRPGWTGNYLLREKFGLPQLDGRLKEGTRIAISISEYFTRMLDPSMDWKDAEQVRLRWGGVFCLKGIMSAADARRAVDIGADAIMVSNHAGRQLDGSRSPFDQIAEIADAVGGRIDIICDGGIRRGTHVLKAISAGATACSGGLFYLYALAAGGQHGVEKALSNMRAEIERDMKLMGVTSLGQLSRENLRYRG
jgi:L-lactate dehydrogenase (cytochrome)